MKGELGGKIRKEFVGLRDITIQKTTMTKIKKEKVQKKYIIKRKLIYQRLQKLFKSSSNR